jgi:hypothetical protein
MLWIDMSFQKVYMFMKPPWSRLAPYYFYRKVQTSDLHYYVVSPLDGVFLSTDGVSLPTDVAALSFFPEPFGPSTKVSISFMYIVSLSNVDSKPCIRAKRLLFDDHFPCLPPPIVSSAIWGVGCDVIGLGKIQFKIGRSVGRLAHITAMANSTLLQLAIPTNVPGLGQYRWLLSREIIYVHVGFSLSMAKSETTRITLITQTLLL